MVAAQKVESESEEAWDRVRPRAMVTAKPGEQKAELGQEIAQLMAALTQIRQGNIHTSTPGSPWEHGHGHGHSKRGNPSHPDSQSSRCGPGQTTLVHSLLTEHRVVGTESQGSEQGN